MANTTRYSAIRNRYITVIEALTPTTKPDKLFRRRNTRLPLDERMTKGASAELLRSFEIRRQVGGEEPAFMDPAAYELKETMLVLVAYPTLPKLYGTSGLDSAEAIIEEDSDLLVNALRDGDNFLLGHHNTFVKNVEIDQSDEDVWLLTITVDLQYYKSSSASGVSVPDSDLISSVADFIMGAGISLADRQWNMSVWRTLITNASAANSVLVLPVGKIEMAGQSTDTVTEESGSSVVVGGYINGTGCKIKGQGKHRTQLYLFSSTGDGSSFSHDFDWVYIDAYTSRPNVEISDLSMYGPTAVNSSGTSSGIRHAGSTSSGDYEVALRHLYTDGLWGYALRSNEGDVHLITEDVYAQGNDPTWGIFSNTNTNTRWTARGVELHATTGGTSVGVYVSPNVGIDVDGMKIYDTDRHAFYVNGTSVTTAPYRKIANLFIDSTCGMGCQLQTNGPTEITNSDINSTTRGIQYQDDLLVSNTRFVGRDIIFAFGAGASGKNVQFDGCTFVGSGTDSIGALIMAEKGVKMSVKGSKIDTTLTNQVIFQANDNSTIFDAANVELHTNSAACLCFSMGPQPTTNTIMSLDGVKQYGSSAYLLGVSDTDAIGSGTRAYWRNCYVGGKTYYLNTPSTVFYGWNNFIASGDNGSIYDATSYQKGVVREGVYHTSVASATTLQLLSSYNTYTITGTTQVDNIYFDGYTKTVEGWVYLIVGGAFSTSSGGNIVPLTTGARTTGTVIRLLQDPSTGTLTEY